MTHRRTSARLPSLLSLVALLTACGNDPIDAATVMVDGEPLDRVLDRIDTQARAAGVAAAEAQGQEGTDATTLEGRLVLSLIHI